MKLAVIDFETYYNSRDGYTLKKMTTEQYIRDAQFHAQMMGFYEPETGHKKVFLYPQGCTWLKDYAVICHNARFDCAILTWRYGIRPRFIIDTLSMARALHGWEGQKLSLDALCERYGIGRKLNAIHHMDGKHVPVEGYDQYCLHDCELTWQLFCKLREGFPKQELEVIDATVRMYTEPSLRLDGPFLQQALMLDQAHKEALLERLGVSREELRSDAKLANLLEQLGVDPPTKTSPTTGKPVYAFAKSDAGLLELLNHDNEQVAQLADARIQVKTSILETRLGRFADISDRGLLPMPYAYYGAHTGRDAGDDKLNVANLPRKGPLRTAILPPEGCAFVVGDSSQIEARMTAWLADQTNLLNWFREGRDVYCEFASSVFGRPITKEDERARYLGKICILGLGYGTGWTKLAVTILNGGVVLDKDLAGTFGANAREIKLFTEKENEKIKKLKTKLGKLELVIHCWCAKQLVDKYRSDFSNIPKLWNRLERTLGIPGIEIGPLITLEDGFLLPNSMKLRYNNLRMDEGKWIYDSPRGVRSLWGGSLLENVIQALAAIVVTRYQLLAARKAGICVVGKTYDELICVETEEEKELTLRKLLDIMHTAPEWAEGCPIAASGGFGINYGSVDK